MAFKAKSTSGTLDYNKRYLWEIANLGNGINHWGYVTADTAAAIDIAGYFSGDEQVAVMKPGDRLTVWNVDGIDDTRSIQDDFAAGMNAIWQTVVMSNDGTTVNVAPLSEAWSLEYSLP